MVVGFGDVETESGKENPAYNAGIRENDVILKTNGQEIKSAAELTDTVGRSNGQEITLTCRRDGTEFTVSLKPVRSLDGNFKTGMWIKDSGAGIGTVTYINSHRPELRRSWSRNLRRSYRKRDPHDSR